MTQDFLILLVKVATTFPRGFPGGLPRGSLHELQVKLPAPLTGRLCRGRIHDLRVKLRTPLTGRVCRGNVHDFRVKERAPLTGRNNQKVRDVQNMKQPKKIVEKALGTSELSCMQPKVIRQLALSPTTIKVSSACVCVATGTTHRKGRVLAVALPPQRTKQKATEKYYCCKSIKSSTFDNIDTVGDISDQRASSKLITRTSSASLVVTDSLLGSRPLLLLPPLLLLLLVLLLLAPTMVVCLPRREGTHCTKHYWRATKTGCARHQTVPEGQHCP